MIIIDPKWLSVFLKKAKVEELHASGEISMSQEAWMRLFLTILKGPVLQTAVVAAIMGVKNKWFNPMCHPLLLTGINCDVEENLNYLDLSWWLLLNWMDKQVEMEALTGVSIGLLTIYDMVKAIDKSMVI